MITMSVLFWILMLCGLVGRFQCFRDGDTLFFPEHWYQPERSHGVATPKNIIDILVGGFQLFHMKDTICALLKFVGKKYV